MSDYVPSEQGIGSSSQVLGLPTWCPNLTDGTSGDAVPCSSCLGGHHRYVLNAHGWLGSQMPSHLICGILTAMPWDS